MKKFVSSLIAFGLVISTIVPGLASAQTSFEANLKLVQDLTNQIKALQVQIQALQSQQTQLRSSANDAVVEIIQNLKPGSEGDQVTLLQTLLAADASLYPEGKVTGFFGPMTRRALQRFQAQNGLDQVGFVGPRTRSLLNGLLRSQFKSVEDISHDVDDETENEIEHAISSITLPPLPTDGCTIPGLPFATTSPIFQKDGKTKLIQTGNVFIFQSGKHKIIITPNSFIEKNGKRQLLITPGMRIEKNGKFRSIIPCNGTTTPPSTSNDTAAPTLSSINTSVTDTSAVVTWITNELANAKVYFSTTTPVNLTSASVLTNGVFQTGHSLSLTGLIADTIYRFVVESKDQSGNTATSSEHAFTTSASADTVAPIITAISIGNIGTSTATISWTTNEAAKSKVYYGTTTPLNTSTALNKSDATLVVSHSMILTGLTPNTMHFFRVESTDASNNTTLASETSFTTAALPVDTTGPVISAVSAAPASTTARITWTTDELSKSKVYYGTTTPLSLVSANNATDVSLVTSHTIDLTSLATSTTFFYVVESKDAANNVSTSTESSFVTGS